MDTNCGPLVTKATEPQSLPINLNSYADEMVNIFSRPVKCGEQLKCDLCLCYEVSDFIGLVIMIVVLYFILFHSAEHFQSM